MNTEPTPDPWLAGLAGLLERTRLLVLLGILLLVLSIVPAVAYLNSTTGIYLVLLLYTVGIFAGSRFIHAYFPWTGTALALVSLFILPGDFMFISALDLNLPVDRIVALLAVGLLAFAGNGALAALAGPVSGGYRLALLGLGLLTAFSRSEVSPWLLTPFTEEGFQVFLVLAAAGLLMLGAAAQASQGRNIRQTILLQGFALYVYLAPTELLGLGPDRLGLFLFLGGLPLLGTVTWLRRSGRWDDVAPELAGELSSWLERPAELLGLALALGGGLLAIGNTGIALAICLVGAVFCATCALLQPERPISRVMVAVATAFLAGLVYWGLKAMATALDWSSLVTALLALALAEEARHAPARMSEARRRTWRAWLTWVAVALTAVAWAEFAGYAAWSYAAFAALLPIALTYCYFALYQQRNVFSYLGVFTLGIAQFGLLTVLNPALSLADYRRAGLALAFIYLGVGYLVQVGSLRAVGALQPPPRNKWGEAPDGWQAWLGADIIRPFRLQERFTTLVPYLIAEPFYSIGLVVVVAAALTGWQDGLVSGLSAIYCLLLFAVYPSRLLLYLAATALTGEGLHLALLVLPDQYRHLGLFLLSGCWLAAGLVLEELLLAGPEASGAQPFYQLGLVVSLLLLRAFFQDWQELYTDAGQARVQQDALLLLLTAVFYGLNLRVYVSKLWLYPLIILASMALYFGSVGRLDPTWQLPGITALAWLWWGVGTLLNRGPRACALLRRLVRRKLPGLDPAGDYYQYHLRDFASPCYASAFYLAGAALAVSAWVLAARPLWLPIFPAAMTPGFAAVQALNLILLAWFYYVYYPRRVPALIGDPEQRRYPPALRYLPLLSLTLAACWPAAGAITSDSLPLIGAAAAWAWGLVAWRAGVLAGEARSELAEWADACFRFSATAIVLALAGPAALFAWVLLAGGAWPESAAGLSWPLTGLAAATYFAGLGWRRRNPDLLDLGAWLLLLPCMGLAYHTAWGFPVAFLLALGCHLLRRPAPPLYDQALGILAAALPAAVALVGQPAPPPYGYLPWLLLGAAHYAVLAARTGAWGYWWLAALLANICLDDTWGRLGISASNAYLLPAGLSLIVLARSLAEPNRARATYLGQFLCALAPMLELTTPFGQTSPGFWLYVGELAALSPLACAAAFLTCRKPFLKFGLALLVCLLVAALVCLMLQPSGLLRWLLMLGMGLGSIALGTYLEVRRERVRAFTSHAADLLAAWE